MHQNQKIFALPLGLLGLAFGSASMHNWILKVFVRPSARRPEDAHPTLDGSSEDLNLQPKGKKETLR